LVRVWGVGEVYRNRTVGLPPAVLNSRWGIIYFNNCFTRTSGGAGDHIDLWNGTQYMNQVFRIGAGGNAGPADDLFSRSNRPGYYIRFFWLLA
jgi:hypothetical protein